jgi:proteasome lid subunit RPN8/RPN11
MNLRASKSAGIQPQVLISGEVLRQIRQHARSSSKTEVCGILIGDELSNGANKIKIAACIAGVNASQAGTHVTFTQDTWEHIYKIKDATFPDDRIVGWYHSHPGFGVFLSDHDTFIHKNFFSAPTQVAWVYDPHSDEEGCFGWIGSRLERLTHISVQDLKGGEGAGETGKPEPIVIREEDDETMENPSAKSSAAPADVWVRRLLFVVGSFVFFAAGYIAAWLYLPARVFVLPVDPYTGRQLGPMIDARELKEPADKVEKEKTGAAEPPQGAGASPAAPSTHPGNPSTSGDKSPNKSSGSSKDPHAP